MKNLSFINKLLYIINLVIVVLWFCAFLSPYINPQTFTLGAILAIAYPILLLTNLFFCIYWLLRFNKVIYLSVGALLLSYFFSVPVFQTKSKFKALAKDNSFSILTFNCQLFYFGGSQKEDVRKHQSKITHYLKQENTDILCLQEARKSIVSSLNYPYQSINGFNHIYSKYEIINFGEIQYNKHSTNKSCYADLLVNYDTIRVYNLHLESLHLGNEDYALLKKWNEEHQEDEFKNKTQNISNKINKAASIRVDQVDRIINSVKDSPYPTLLCGDFNDVPQSYIYRKLKGEHNDAFLASGKGFGATFQQLIFPFRIDYILTDKSWSVYNFEVLDEKLSDHQAIRCDVETN